MKTKLLLFWLSILLSGPSFAQLMPFGFVKNCMGFGRTTVTDELKKKHFLIKERDIKQAENPVMVGSTYYSNAMNKAEGEIAVLSNIQEKKSVTEISFLTGVEKDFTANYDDVYNQTVNFFKKETYFKSTRYNTEVSMFNKEYVYYYFYKKNNVPTIVISNYKVDKEYFMK